MEGSDSNTNSKSSSVIVRDERKGLQAGFRIENPFSFKVAQVFTGFGIGCGVGIGVGRPLNLNALPMVNQVMSATRGATDAFSGVSWHVNSALRKLGANNIQAGIGCGVGFGHGLGVGLALKPGVLKKIQVASVQVIMNVMKRFGIASNIPVDQGSLLVSSQSDTGTLNELSIQKPSGNISQLATKFPDKTSNGLHGYGSIGAHSSRQNLMSETNPLELSFSSRTEKVISSFLQSPILKEEDGNLNEMGRIRTENNMLQMVLKHQQIIEELMEENDKLRKVLVEDLKVPIDKLQGSFSSRYESPCDSCFECRRKQRRLR
ncbi:hypothetical protein K2173_016864 [Erythroxylum novogranatense]|uniref:Uncharacterized protein n=1 Tax=Erythroxylum novogranatense TaxID=1862640 RepID=A0AAV8U594_9ROSI|nr:hypothetical protein K2173_016864 [Erythroxylum novogranatense]